MNKINNIEVFLQPESVAVIGATERPGAWGSFITNGLLSMQYPGKIYPVNHRTNKIYGISTFTDILKVPGPVDLAILTIPEKQIEYVIKACGEKGVKGITIITAGFGESIEGGEDRERKMTQIAHSYNMRILGPNISGTFNLHSEFMASPSRKGSILPTSLAAVCQGGFAFYDLMISGKSKGMGIGKFIHTGNECDLQVTDFLEYFGNDPQVKGIIMYLETVRDGRRFIETARKVAKKKPIIVHKAGWTEGGSRAAKSHTGALGGRDEVFKGLFGQTNIIYSPSMELLLPLGHALIELPPMKGNRVGIITMGGSWGVPLTDCLEKNKIKVPELSLALQSRLREIGMPPRASTRNPVDIGAAGAMSLTPEILIKIGEILLSSDEIDALIFHGFGRPGMEQDENSIEWKFFLEIEKKVLRHYIKMQKEFSKPVMFGSIFSKWESQAVHDLNEDGIHFYDRLDEIAQILSLMHKHRKKSKH